MRPCWQVPYHNRYHAFNVVQGCYSLCSTTAVGQQLPKPAQVWYIGTYLQFFRVLQCVRPGDEEYITSRDL